MKHFFRYKDGYVTVNAETIYITHSKKLSRADFNGKNILHQSKLLFYYIYFLALGICIWLHSYLLLVIVSVLLGVKYISGKRTAVITIPFGNLINIRKTDKAVILAYTNQDGETTEHQLLKKIDKKDFDVLKSLKTKL
ncbi:hypothetical protein CHU92_13520 [Flavobacterium cyanobacteriorum]|uniref:Uncharacterized protein n=2 Tax=Flavobacterium cyanobacteriorum TaxID=2022802 RepID=A0A255YWU3_9FLAO|nr:hypothetical protein CHU92_13520 [Flavobacterium cyanobacteriorum]